MNDSDGYTDNQVDTDDGDSHVNSGSTRRQQADTMAERERQMQEVK